MPNNDIKQILLTIIEYGLLNARWYSNEGECEQAWNEANHVHNLPSLIRDGGIADVQYYLSAECESYLRDASGRAPMRFDKLWNDLREASAGQKRGHH